jgi:hypothetical protein
MTAERLRARYVMFYRRMSFLVGAFLHLLFLFTRVNILHWRCVAGDCSGLFFADFPVSLIYLAFPDGVLIVFSLLSGTVLWGLYGLAVERILQRLFGEHS